MKKLLLAASLIAMLSGTANAAVYVANRTVGTATATISITTDDTIGILESDNILDWSISMTNGADFATLLGPNGGSDSRVQIGGSALSATATDLSFNFSAAGNSYVLFQSFTPGRPSYCLQSNGCFDYNGGAEIINPSLVFDYERGALSGVQTIASVAAVPEPASWAMMLIGFGSMGATMRSARKRQRLAIASA